MHEHITTISQRRTQKFHKNLKNPKRFSKTQNLGLKMHECMKKKGLRTFTKRFRLDLGEKTQWVEDLSEGEKIWSRERDIYQERMREMNSKSCLNLK